MADRRILVISIVLFVASAAIFICTIFMLRFGGGVAELKNESGGVATQDTETRNHGYDQSSEIDDSSTSDEFPKNLAILPALNDGAVSGSIVCGNCSFKTGEPCNVMLWDESGRHLVTVLPNKNYDRLNKLTAAT